MRNMFLIIICSFLIQSCEKNNDLTDDNLYLEKPEIPSNDTIDVNSDQIYDFVISYREFATYDLPSSSGSIIGSVSPLDQNQLLYRDKAGYLFLEINDTIRSVSNSGSGWNGYSADLISIDRDYQNWNKTWTVISDKTNYYFLAYKLVLNNSEEVGWICLDFDTTNGKMSVTDGDHSDNSELIIEKKTTD